MSDSVQSRVDQLERTVLELGAELYTLKGTFAKQNESHTRFLAIVKGLKQLLDEKGLITLDDFDAAVQLGEALESFNSSRDTFNEIEKLKKTGH